MKYGWNKQIHPWWTSTRPSKTWPLWPQRPCYLDGINLVQSRMYLDKLDPTLNFKPILKHVSVMSCGLACGSGEGASHQNGTSRWLIMAANDWARLRLPRIEWMETSLQRKDQVGLWRSVVVPWPIIFLDSLYQSTFGPLGLCFILFYSRLCHQADVAKSDQIKQLEQRSDELKGVVDDRLQESRYKTRKTLCFLCLNRLKLMTFSILWHPLDLATLGEACSILPMLKLRKHISPTAMERPWERHEETTEWILSLVSILPCRFNLPEEMNRQGEQIREQLDFLMQATEMLKRRLREMTKSQTLYSRSIILEGDGVWDHPTFWRNCNESQCVVVCCLTTFVLSQGMARWRRFPTIRANRFNSLQP